VVMFTNAQDMCIRKNYLLKYPCFEMMYFQNISSRFVATVIYSQAFKSNRNTLYY